MGKKWTKRSLSTAIINWENDFNRYKRPKNAMAKSKSSFYKYVPKSTIFTWKNGNDSQLELYNLVEKKVFNVIENNLIDLLFYGDKDYRHYSISAMFLLKTQFKYKEKDKEIDSQPINITLNLDNRGANKLDISKGGVSPKKGGV